MVRTMRYSTFILNVPFFNFKVKIITNVILNIANTKIAFLLFCKDKFIIFSNNPRINLNEEINNFQFLLFFFKFLNF